MNDVGVVTRADLARAQMQAVSDNIAEFTRCQLRHDGHGSLPAGEDDPLRRLQGAVDRLAECDDVEERVYLDACNALKDLYPATNLYQLTYTIFFNDGGAVLTRERTVVMERHGTIDYGWRHVLDRDALPDNMHGLCLYTPFHCGDEQAMVTSVKPYLKRGREAGDDAM